MTKTSTNPLKQQRYLELPDSMYSLAVPASVPAPELCCLNHALLNQWQLDAAWFESADGLASLAGNQTNPSQSVAMAYAGHQFANWVPLLGDGRAHLLGQLQTGYGEWLDLQLKGSGRTPYSRGGDGKATLSSALREYLISEAMAGLGIPTTRSLAVIATGEPVQREEAVAGGIVARSAQSHIRVGSFQYAAASLEQDELQALADYMLRHHFSDIQTTEQDRYAQLISAASERQAVLVTQWMLVGFIHGVMNTDNMSIVGETIDFGPCAFLDEFNPGKVFSSIDQQGRYGWNQQGSIAYWNLARFTETLLPLLSDDQDQAVEIAKQSLKTFETRFPEHFEAGLAAKLGTSPQDPSFESLSQTLWPLLGEQAIDFTLFFDRLTLVAAGEPEALLLELFTDTGPAEQWLQDWRQAFSTDADTMRQANPRLIARNHQVEQALSDASERDDWALFNRLAAALANPYDVADDDLDLLVPPAEGEKVQRTFCGT